MKLRLMAAVLVAYALALVNPAGAQEEPATPLTPAEARHSAHIAVNVAGEQLGYSFTLPKGMTFDAQVQLTAPADDATGTDRVRSASLGLGYTKDLGHFSLVFAGHANYTHGDFAPMAELRLERGRYIAYAEYHFDPPEGIVDLAQECWEAVCVGVGLRLGK